MAEDAVDVLSLTRSLVDIDSTTGREREAGRWLADYLRRRGFAVTEQPVDGERFNIIAAPAASAGPVAPADPSPAPQIVLSTHFDCVPPFFPSRVEGDRLFGRGSCDAKGIAAAMVAAADRLHREGEMRVGLLFVVGEERGSDGARKADEAANGTRFLINGEPTDNRFGLATRGILRVKLRATGRAAHSAFPELGESAIDKLIDALVDLRAIELPVDEVLGRTHYSVGLITGGIAPNVVPPSAAAEVMFRTVSDASLVRTALAPLEQRVAIEDVLEVAPVRMTTIAGFPASVFAYTTDIPFLTRWGKPLLFGPGSIHVAHTADEFVSIAELRAASDYYVTIARALLEQV